MSQKQAFYGFNVSILLKIFLLLLVCVAADISPRTSDNLIVFDYGRHLPPTVFMLKYLKPMEKSESRMEPPSTIESYQIGNDRDNVSSSGMPPSHHVGQKKSMPFHLPFQKDGYYVRGISMFGTRNPIVEGYKRGPGFRSWGGKRTLIPRDQPQDVIK